MEHNPAQAYRLWQLSLGRSRRARHPAFLGNAPPASAGGLPRTLVVMNRCVEHVVNYRRFYRDTRLNVGRSGLPCFHGKGDHNLIVPYEDDLKEEYRTVISRVRMAECSWAVTLADDDPHPLAGAQWRKLVEISREDSTKTHGMISYLAGSDSNGKLADLVQFIIIPSKPAFAHIHRLFEIVISGTFRYDIEILFTGFHVHSENSGEISWKEFGAGRLYYFSESAFSVARLHPA